MSDLVQLTRFSAPQSAWHLKRKEIVPAAPQRVWKALTNPEELARWWCDHAEIDLVHGGRFTFSGETVFASQDANECILTELVPEERLQFRWTLFGVETLVTYELANLMELTELRVVHTAEAAPLDWAVDSRMPNWWWVSLPSLRSYVEDGRSALRVNYRQANEAPPVSLAADFTTFPWVIWSKLTEAEELSKWWGNSVKLDLVAGGEFDLGIEEFGPRRIVAVEDGQRLVHDWQWNDGATSTVEWTIQETEESTRVTLRDEGPWSNDAQREHRLVYWASSLLLLKQMSESGVTPREYQDD